jgi:hypothetical protein
VVEYQSLGIDPSGSPVPGTIYYHISSPLLQSITTYAFICFLGSRRVCSYDLDIQGFEHSSGFSSNVSVSLTPSAHLCCSFLFLVFVHLGSERDSRGNRLFYRIVILNLFLHLRVYLLDELLCRGRPLMAISLVTVYAVSLLVSVAAQS